MASKIFRACIWASSELSILPLLLFTTPLATGIPFNWKDLTPVAMMALDEFVLWVNVDKPYKNVKDYVDAIKAAPPAAPPAPPPSTLSRRIQQAQGPVELAPVSDQPITLQDFLDLLAEYFGSPRPWRLPD
mgnify:CR=1 FL=1